MEINPIEELVQGFDVPIGDDFHDVPLPRLLRVSLVQK
jgi:hypothetical protein